MKWFMAILLIFFASSAMAQTQYTFQITDERDAAGKCINFQDITADVPYALNTDGTKQVFSDRPDENSLDNDDTQEWYVDAPAGGFYLVSFSFSAVGLTIPNNSKYLQYWFRYSKDGVLYSESNAVVVMKPGKAAHR